MDEGGLLARMGSSISRFYGLVGAASEGASVIRFPGVLGCICPAVPERSIFNSIAYGGYPALHAALEDLGHAYAAAGVRAWMVWVPDGDREAAKMLRKAGHDLVARPRAMGMELADLPGSDPGDLDWSDQGSVAELSSVNDRAYGYPADTFERGLRGFPAEEALIYVARLGGDSCAALMTVDVDGDCGVYFVATIPDAQGMGLVSRLLNLALTAARERGCTTATLQATRAGRPVYERLGFVDLIGMQMWERRS